VKRTVHILFVAAVVGCGGVEDQASLGNRSDYADQESWNPVIILTREAKKRTVVRASHLAKYDEKQEIVLDGNVDADFFSTDEEHMSNLKSERAFVYENSDNLLAIGNVVVVSDSGVKLFTDSLYWENQNERITSNDTVMLTTEVNDTLYGVGFESDVDLTHWKILQPWGVTAREK
tara:strand:- start:4641 stop:5168 length:528 start_codon:yes stop_codon:yes gene_type:complete